MVASDDIDACSLAIEIEEMLKQVPPYRTDRWIFKLPGNLRNGNEDAYTPNVVSIGPLHHGEEQLQAMQMYKMRYLNDCLSYNPNITVVDHVRRLKALEERVRDTYNQDDFPCSFSSNEFVTMMLLDGCFIIQLFILARNWDVADSYDPDMFATQYLYTNVQSDMIMVENQLPFFLLEDLFNFILTDEQRGTGSFLYLTFDYFKAYIEMEENVFLRKNGVQVKHFVDILLKCYLPLKTYVAPLYGTRYDHLPSATELQNLGVQFKRSKNQGFLDITFRNGVLEIPKLLISGSTKTTFRNIIAMEQCHRDTKSYVTDYMILMDYLINTPSDVAVLKSCKVIDSYFGNDEEVCELINTMVDGVIRGTTESHYYGIIHELNVYSNRSWHQWKAKVRKDYFSSPLTILSLIAAATLLFCTIVQTLFTVLSFTG